MNQKILYIITQGHWGGAQKYVADLGINLSKMPGYDVMVACGEKSEDLFNALKDTQVKTIKLKHLVRAVNPLKDISGFLEIIRLLKIEQFDIVHANSSKAGFLTALAHKWLKITNSTTYRTKLIYTAHGWVFMEPLHCIKKIIFLLMEWIAAKLRNATIVLSQREKNIALRYGATKKNSIFIIPNGINCESINFFDKITARKIIENKLNKSFDNESPWIGTIANLYKTKGIEIFIQAAAQLLNNQTNAKQKPLNVATPYFFVIGEGPERTSLETLIKKLNLPDSFYLIGTIENAPQLLKAFDLFVLSSLKEGLPFALLEAACANIPLIASDAGAVPEIIQNEENGLIVPSGHSKKLTGSISRILNDTALYTKLKNNTQAISQKFSLERTIEETKKVYLQFYRRADVE